MTEQEACQRASELLEKMTPAQREVWFQAARKIVAARRRKAFKVIAGDAT